jgi:hypothetical protein
MTTTNFVDLTTVIPTAWCNDVDARTYEFSSYESLTGIKTIDSADNGKTFGLNADPGVIITLPTCAAAGAGFHCIFRVEAAFGTTSWVITATSTLINLRVNEASGGAGELDANATSVNFAFGAETIGDVIHLSTNGSVWFAQGFCEIANGITATA